MTSTFMTTFGATVRRLREERSMTQIELASRVGLGRTSMTNLESGKQTPPLSLLPKLAEALGMTSAELVAHAEASVGNDHPVALMEQVHDDELRRWASQVIGKNLANKESQLPTRHRKARR